MSSPLFIENMSESRCPFRGVRVSALFFALTALSARELLLLSSLTLPAMSLEIGSSTTARNSVFNAGSVIVFPAAFCGECSDKPLTFELALITSISFVWLAEIGKSLEKEFLAFETTDDIDDISSTLGLMFSNGDSPLP